MKTKLAKDIVKGDRVFPTTTNKSTKVTYVGIGWSNNSIIIEWGKETDNWASVHKNQEIIVE